ncbi:MAG TPA: hypothetical protein VLT16_02015, partial [Candidatus Limnocylindrales bacterium]|nr:hypothetical protein [Candidatus Limnocylindrales bacterium]
QRDRYRDHMIYLVLHEGHSVRVSILDANRVAVTNMASSDPMHEIIDGSLSPADGPSLEQSYYRRVPLASLGWMISRIPGDSRSPQLPNGWSFDFLENTVVVASLRFKGDLLLRADVIAPTGDDAKRVVDSAGNFLSMYRAVSQSVGARGSDPDVKSAIDSIQAQQNKNVAVFTATLSQRFLKKLVSDAQSGIAAPSPTPAPTPKPQRKRHKRRG